MHAFDKDGHHSCHTDVNEVLDVLNRLLLIIVETELVLYLRGCIYVRVTNNIARPNAPIMLYIYIADTNYTIYYITYIQLAI